MMPAQWVRQDGRSQLGGRAKVAFARGGIDARFKQYDRNADGKLTPDEFPRAAVFRERDANKDGFVTLEEAKAYYGSVRRRPGNSEEYA